MLILWQSSRLDVRSPQYGTAGRCAFTCATFSPRRPLLSSCAQQVTACGQHRCHTSSCRSPTPFTASQAWSNGSRLHIRQSQHTQVARGQRQMQTHCVAPNSQSIGRRVVGGVATAAFLTWALQSASAKSMKPGQVQKRSREEEDATFENRQGEVSYMSAVLPTSGYQCQGTLLAAGATYRCRMEVFAESRAVQGAEAIRHRTTPQQPLRPCKYLLYGSLCRNTVHACSLQGLLAALSSTSG